MFAGNPFLVAEVSVLSKLFCLVLMKLGHVTIEGTFMINLKYRFDGNYGSSKIQLCIVIIVYKCRY